MNLAPGVFASLLSAGKDFPRTLSKYIRDGPKPAAHLRSVEPTEPNCDQEFYDLVGCIYKNDMKGAEGCGNCIFDLNTGLDWERDVCAQQADKAATDEKFCPAVDACEATCTALLEGTEEACAAAWDQLIGCSGLSEEEFVAVFADPCPGLCEGDVVEIA